MSKPIYDFKVGTASAGWGEQMDANVKAMEAQDKEAKKNGTLVGRFVEHGYADGAAYYVIVRENKKSVRIHVVAGIGDDWVLPAWGIEFTLSKEQAIRIVTYRDSINELLGGSDEQ